MRTWFRVVLPSGAMVAFCILIYVASFAPTLVFWYFGGEGTFTLEKTGITPRQYGLHLLGIVAFAYAAYRSFAFHPAFLEEYRQWLNQTPWRFGLPLPAGPVHLVPQDVAVVSLLSGLATWHWWEFWWAIPSVFLTTYLLGVSLSFLRTEHPKHAYLIVFGFAGVVLSYNHSIGVGIVLALLYGVAYHGLCDWLKQPNLPVCERLLSFDSQAVRNRKLGWPFDALGPQRDPNPVSVAWAAAMAVLAGWWAFVVLTVLPDEKARAMFVMLLLGFGFVLAFGRLGKYIWGYLPPINFWGRLRTSRWIIPGYDVIFVAPLLIVGLNASMKWLISDFRLPFEVVVPVVTSAQIFIALGFPPSLDQWRFTGNHRIVPTVSKQEFQQIS